MTITNNLFYLANVSKSYYVEEEISDAVVGYFKNSYFKNFLAANHGGGFH